MTYTNGALISVKGTEVWKGEYVVNGRVELDGIKPRDATSFSSITASDSLKAKCVNIPYGVGIWRRADQGATLSGTVYAGKPDTTNSYKFLGILEWEQGGVTGFPFTIDPVFGGGIQDYMKGTVIKRGFVQYNTLYAGSAGFTAGTLVSWSDSAFTLGDCLFVEDTTGLPVLVGKSDITYTNGVPTLSGYTFVAPIDDVYQENKTFRFAMGWSNGLAL